jgi:archaellum component FlaC
MATLAQMGEQIEQLQKQKDRAKAATGRVAEECSAVTRRVTEIERSISTVQELVRNVGELNNFQSAVRGEIATTRTELEGGSRAPARETEGERR